MKKLKQKLVTWLLKDLTLGYTIDHNELNNCTIVDSSINLQTNGNIILDRIKLPDDVEVIIRKADTKK